SRFQRLIRASVSSPARQPRPTRAASNALAFRLPFCPPPFAGNSAEQTVRTPIVSGFCSDPAWQPSELDAYDLRILATSVSQIVGSSEKVDTSASGNFSQLPAVGRSSLRPTCLPSLKTPRSG